MANERIERARAIFSGFFGESIFPEGEVDRVQRAILDMIDSGQTDEQILQALAEANPQAVAAGDRRHEQVRADLGVRRDGASAANPQQASPVAQALTDATTLLEQALAMAPDQNDPRYAEDPGGYTTDWMLWLQTVQSAAQTQAQLAQLDAGVVTLDDGTVITSSMLNDPDPAVRAQYQAAYDSRLAEAELGYTTLLDELGITSYNAFRQGVEGENTRKTQDFTNRVNRFNAELDWDQQNVERAAKDVARSIEGLAESQRRAKLLTDTALDAAPWATQPGKSSFTGADLGAGITALARQAGIKNPETAPLLNFTGTQRIDPGGLMQGYDQQLGVQGPVPLIPQMRTDPNTIPNAPLLSEVPQFDPSTLQSPAVAARLLGALQQAQQGGAQRRTAPLLPGAYGEPPGMLR